MRLAVVTSAIRRNDISLSKDVLVDVIVVDVMQMSVVQVIRVRVVLHRGMSAVRSVQVIMALMGLMRRHRSSYAQGRFL